MPTIDELYAHLDGIASKTNFDAVRMAVNVFAKDNGLQVDAVEPRDHSWSITLSAGPGKSSMNLTWPTI